MEQTIEERYAAAAARLVRMMDGRDLHAGSGECDSLPLCMGPVGMADLLVIAREAPRTLSTLVMTAVGMLCEMRQDLAEARAWKRDLAAQLEQSAELWEQERQEALAREVTLLAVLAAIGPAGSGS